MRRLNIALVLGLAILMVTVMSSMVGAFPFLACDLGDDAEIVQYGLLNDAYIYQKGETKTNLPFHPGFKPCLPWGCETGGNYAEIFQMGYNNKGSITQVGALNYASTSVYGFLNDVNISQNGAVLTAVIGQGGFLNKARVTQSGGLNVAMIGQCGSHNMAAITQTAVLDNASISQMGHLNNASILQN